MQPFYKSSVDAFPVPSLPPPPTTSHTQIGLHDATILDAFADLAAAAEAPGACGCVCAYAYVFASTHTRADTHAGGSAPWSELPDCPHDSIFQAAATDLSDLRAYLTAKHNNDGVLDVFDAGGQQWLTAPTRMTARWGPAMTFLLDGRLLVVTRTHTRAHAHKHAHTHTSVSRP